MKKPSKDWNLACFSETWPMSKQDRKILFDFYDALLLSTNVPVKSLPRHLLEPLQWLLGDDFRWRVYPAKEPRQKPPKVLYFVGSIARELKQQEGDYVFHNLPIDWVYSDQKNRPLVNYSDSIVGYDHLNHWGVMNAIQRLDEAFSEDEANLLKKYLDKDERMMTTKIIRHKLPFHPGYDSIVLIDEGRVDLHKEEGYDLPFKVKGVYVPRG